ncbi:hypothetical protein [Streptomyces sp. NPDC049916]|uniref:hypothetical protein n=1 Tax=Streptomyces sp. NPDC049916 TaxID=3155156 RepID=UPI003419C057
MTLTRGARITGAVLCAIPALLIIAWIVRDIRAAGGPELVWNFWAGTGSPGDVVPLTTSVTSAVLVVAYAAAAVAALRSAAASSVLIVTGAVTVVLRLPGVWTIAEAPDPEQLRDLALMTTYAVLVSGLALIVLGAVGRRGAPEGAERPRGPGRGTGVAVLLLLGFQGALFTAWEIRQTFVYPSELYPAWFVGGEPINIPLTEGPPGWVTGTTVMVFLVAAVGAVAGAAFARPLGLVAGGFALCSGVLGVARVVHFEMYERFPDLGTETQLNILSFVSSLLVGPVVIVLLARKGVDRTPGGLPGPWGGTGPGGAPQPWGPPWPSRLPAAAPGFGPPPGGDAGPPAPGFGPPPESPPPRW